MTMTQQHRERQQASWRDRRGTIAAGVVIVLLAVVAAVWVAIRHHREVGSAPYTDPASAGAITLCRGGRPITSGSTVDQPFATVAVGGQAAAGGYASNGTATVFAYQPRQGVGPESWSGLQLGPASQVTDPKAPAAVLVKADTTLAQFVNAYPAQDGGWIQLRLILGAAGQAPQTASYATLDLHIDGTTWTAVGAGTAACPSS